MIKEVMKKGGGREAFDPNKIRKAIASAVQKSSLSQKEKDEIIEKVFNGVIDFLKEKKEIATVEIEAKILLELDKLAPEASKIWREFRIKKEK
jgi:transcriptional regulator NrdR family protein